MNPVLVVEDDEGDALLVMESLREAGWDAADVEWRRTLAEGVAALVAKPRCVLLDLGLPDAEGLAAVHRVVEQASGSPVIVLTGRNERTGIDAVAAGAQDYLVKDDLTPDLLDRSIRYAVERARAQAAELQLRAQRLHAAENARLERGLLPRPLLRSSGVRCSTYYQPGSDMAVLGGDFFDVVETSDGRVRAVIGDVMGHGPDQAALGVHLRVAWRTLVLAGAPDHEVLPTLSSLLSAETGVSRAGTLSDFVTVLDVTLDPDLRATFRVAGHPAPLLGADGHAGWVPVEVGPPLGLEAMVDTRRWAEQGGWPVTTTRLAPGSSLVLFTDGLLESYRVPDSRDSIGVDELLGAANSPSTRGVAVADWITTLVGQAPTPSADDTAVVVLTVDDRGAGDRAGDRAGAAAR